MSEPRIAVRCPKCGETTLIKLTDRAILEDYFRCPKCGNVDFPKERPRPPEEPTEED